MQIGAKIRQLRIANQMTQEELADRRSFRKALSARLKTTLLRRPLNTLVDILQCLGTDLKTFFSDSEDKQIVFREKDYFQKQITNLKTP